MMPIWSMEKDTLDSLIRFYKNSIISTESYRKKTHILQKLHNCVQILQKRRI